MRVPNQVWVHYPRTYAEKDQVHVLRNMDYKVFIRVPDEFPNPEWQEDPTQPRMKRPNVRRPVFRLGIGVGMVVMERHAQMITEVFPKILAPLAAWWSHEFRVPVKDKLYQQLLEEACNDTCPETAYLDWDTYEWKCPKCQQVLKHRFSTCGSMVECEERSTT
jgi:hypothetical protein